MNCCPATEDFGLNGGTRDTERRLCMLTVYPSAGQ